MEKLSVSFIFGVFCMSLFSVIIFFNTRFIRIEQLLYQFQLFVHLEKPNTSESFKFREQKLHLIAGGGGVPTPPPSNNC